MCKSDQPQQSTQAPDVQTFDSVDDFLDAVEPGMDLCTSDFTGWAEVEAVQRASDAQPAVIVGRVRESGSLVHVPTDVLIDIRGGHCVRLDRARATVNEQGWEVE